MKGKEFYKKGREVCNDSGRGRMFKRLTALVVSLLALSFTSLQAHAGGGIIEKIKVVPGNVISPGQGFGVYVEGQGVCDDLALFVLPPQSQQQEWKWYNVPPFNGKSAYDLSNSQKLSSTSMGNILGNPGVYSIIARPGPHAKICKGRAESKVVIKESSISKPGTSAAPSRPDLVVQSITLHKKPNGQCVPYITVKNKGSAGVPVSKYHKAVLSLIKPPTSPSSPVPYYYVGDYFLSAVDPGHALTHPGGQVGFEWKAEWLKPGAYAFGAIVDTDNKVTELNEGNNTLAPKSLVCGRPAPKHRINIPRQRLKTPEGR